MVAMMETARGGSEEDWESDFIAIFHMYYTSARMTTRKKASPETMVEVADGNILPVDGLGRMEVDLEKPCITTKLVKMGAVAHVPELSRNLLSTLEVLEHWIRPLYYRTKTILGFPMEESFVFNFCSRKGLFSATFMRQIPSQVVALAVAVKARNMMEVHLMLAHPSEDITRKRVEAMGIATMGQWGYCEACLQTEAK